MIIVMLAVYACTAQKSDARLKLSFQISASISRLRLLLVLVGNPWTEKAC